MDGGVDGTARVGAALVITQSAAKANTRTCDVTTTDVARADVTSASGRRVW